MATTNFTTKPAALPSGAFEVSNAIYTEKTFDLRPHAVVVVVSDMIRIFSVFEEKFSDISQQRRRVLRYSIEVRPLEALESANLSRDHVIMVMSFILSGYTNIYLAVTILLSRRNRPEPFHQLPNSSKIKIGPAGNSVLNGRKQSMILGAVDLARRWPRTHEWLRIGWTDSAGFRENSGLEIRTNLLCNAEGRGREC